MAQMIKYGMPGVWTHAFDVFEIDYDLIFRERVKAGNLRAKYDVILMPSQGRSGNGLGGVVEIQKFVDEGGVLIQTLMRFRGTDAAVLSGLMKGAAEIRNRPATAEVQAGKGRIVMFATNPCFRYENLGEFNMLFNAVLHDNDVTRSWDPGVTPATRVSRIPGPFGQPQGPSSAPRTPWETRVSCPPTHRSPLRRR